MGASGTLSIRFEFSDSTTRETKTISKLAVVSEDLEFASVPVAIMSGTVGTAAVSVSINPTTYRNAGGDFVSFATAPARIALQADGPSAVSMTDSDLNEFSASSRNGSVAVTRWGLSSPSSGVLVQTASGTNTYAIVVIGEEQ